MMTTAIEQLRADHEKATGGLRADNETTAERLRADNETAVERLRANHERAIGGLHADLERLRTTIERNSRTLLFQMIGVVAACAGITSALIKILDS